MKRLALLASLYLAQGLPYGFFTLAVPAVLRQEGHSLRVVGLSSALALPWALKFLWAPAVDRWGRRKTWIVALQTVTVLVLLALATVSAEAAPALAVGMLVASLLAATQDIATDGLAVRLLSPAERGLGNGVQVAGYRLGMILGGSAILWVFARMGWAAAFGGMALVLALLTVPIARWPERAADPVDATPLDLLGTLRAIGPRWVGVLLTLKLGEAAAGAMVRPWLIDAGWSLEGLGGLLGVGGSAFGLVGALIGGWLAGRSRIAAVVGSGVAQATCIAALAVAGDGVVPLVLVEHVASGMTTAALFTAMMDRCRHRLEATDYTLQASLVVISAGLGASLSGFGAEALGYPWFFAGCAGLGLLAAGLAAHTMRSTS